MTLSIPIMRQLLLIADRNLLNDRFFPTKGSFFKFKQAWGSVIKLFYIDNFMLFYNYQFITKNYTAR